MFCSAVGTVVGTIPIILCLSPYIGSLWIRHELTLKRKLERMRTHYRSKVSGLLKLILQLTFRRIFARLRLCSVCINDNGLSVYAWQSQNCKNYQDMAFAGVARLSSRVFQDFLSFKKSVPEKITFKSFSQGYVRVNISASPSVIRIVCSK